ncbi:MAG: cupin-like domain-containing protein [Burkholderiales bacterium]|nr:cupin-like domain-containing protein [Bacteroidia bacterium]
MITLADVISNIKEGGKKYYRFYPLLARRPEHIKDFDINWLKERAHKKSLLDSFQVFMGGKGTFSDLHNANPPNLFVQVCGEKQWILYSHYYSPIIDPPPIANIYRVAPPKKEDRPFNPFKPNFEAPYELFKYMDGYSVTLKPGDVLWNTLFYWHAVQNATDSIGVGFRWIVPWYSFKISPLFMFLDLFSTKRPIWKAWGLYKKDMNEVHLH